MAQTYRLMLLIIAGNIFLMIAGWNHPEESNLASYLMWLIISLTYLYTSVKLKLSLSLGIAFVSGNIFLITCALLRGGYTFNLGQAEYMSLYTVLAGITCWSTYGAITKKWDARLLLLATIAADILSFYPQNKQYFGINDPPSKILMLGFGTWVVAMLYNIVFIDKFFEKLFDDSEKKSVVIINSALSIENFIFLLVTLYVMSG